MDFTGKPLKTRAFVEPAGIESGAELASWIGEALAFANICMPGM